MSTKDLPMKTYREVCMTPYPLLWKQSAEFVNQLLTIIPTELPICILHFMSWVKTDFQYWFVAKFKLLQNMMIHPLFDSAHNFKSKVADGILWVSQSCYADDDDNK